jgi:hypothetical protein
MFLTSANRIADIAEDSCLGKAPDLFDELCGRVSALRGEGREKGAHKSGGRPDHQRLRERRYGPR